VAVHGGPGVGLNGGGDILARTVGARFKGDRVVVSPAVGLDQIPVLAYGVADGSLVEDREERRDGQHDERP
jgi:hypothetical protein